MSPVGRSHLRNPHPRGMVFATLLQPLAPEKAGAPYRGLTGSACDMPAMVVTPPPFDLTARDWTRIKAYRIERPRCCRRSVGTRSSTADPPPAATKHDGGTTAGEKHLRNVGGASVDDL